MSIVDDPRDADLAVVLGGDGTMLRTLARAARHARAGDRHQLRPGRVPRLDRAGEPRAATWSASSPASTSTVELPTLKVRLDGERYIAVNDVVVTSSTLGKMIELAWSIGGEDLGTVPCDGMICSTPSGSTAYNLSNGGPVLVRGLDAMAVTFIAPHSLDARPFVVPRGARGDRAERHRRRSPRRVLVDGHRVAEIPPGEDVAIYLADERSLLATLPETTFFSRYRETFTS